MYKAVRLQPWGFPTFLKVSHGQDGLPATATCWRLNGGRGAGTGCREQGCRGLTLQVHFVQLSTTQVSFSAKNRPSCQQADMFLVFGGPPMSSHRNWLSFDWKTERGFQLRQEHYAPSHHVCDEKPSLLPLSPKHLTTRVLDAAFACLLNASRP